MKNNRIVIFISLFLLSACSGNQKDKSEIYDQGSTLRFSLIVPIDNHSYWDTVRDGVESALQGRNVNLDFVGPASIDQQKQIEFIETAVASKVDGIITQALDPEAFGPVIEKSAIAGIPLVLIESDAPESRRDLYVGSDNFAAGRVAGKLMEELSGGSAQIGIITGVAKQYSHQQRIDGFNYEINKHSGMKVVVVEVSNNDLLNAMRLTTEILISHPEVNSFFGVSSNDIEGVAKVISEKSNRDSFTLIGFDAMDYTIDSIRRGLVQATIKQEPFNMGVLAAEYLLKDIKERSDSDPIHYTGHIAITRDNVDDYF